MSATPDLKPWQLQEAARAALQAAPLFAGDMGEGVPVIPVIPEDGTKKDEIESALSDDGPGACIEVSLPHDGAKRDQRGSGVILDNTLTVILYVNPTRNIHAGAANLNAVEGVCAIITALVQRARHPGGEFFQLAADGYSLEQLSGGLLVYALQFSKETTL